MQCAWRPAGQKQPLPVLAAADVPAATVRAAAAAGPAGGPAAGPAAGLADEAAIGATGDRIGADPAIDIYRGFRIANPGRQPGSQSGIRSHAAEPVRSRTGLAPCRSVAAEQPRGETHRIDVGR